MLHNVHIGDIMQYCAISVIYMVNHVNGTIPTYLDKIKGADGILYSIYGHKSQTDTFIYLSIHLFIHFIYFLYLFFKKETLSGRKHKKNNKSHFHGLS